MHIVRRDKCGNSPDPVMGHDWRLDTKVRVGFLNYFFVFCWRDSADIMCRFHNKWEFWAYNVVFGLFQAPYYAFSQTMMAELSPPGFDNMVRLIYLFPISRMKKKTHDKT
jgi:Vacuole effluxer Atg22 like